MANQEDNELDPTGLTDELAKKYDPERLLKAFGKRAGKSEALDHSVRHRYERRFGVDLGHVRVITGEFAEEFNKKRDAYAVTVGSTGLILMGGSPDRSMASAAGQGLLAHELTHVAQSKQGLHRAATSAGAMPYTEEHEAEAEAVEAEVASGGARESSGSQRLKSEDAKKERIEKVKQRVLELVADALRVQMMRNGVQRRP